MNPWERNENHGLAINSSKAVGCRIVNIQPEFIDEGRPYIVLGLIWQIIKIGLLNDINLKAHPELVRLLDEGEELADLLKMNLIDLLIRWVNYHLKNVGSDRRIRNFEGSIKDSEVYTILLSQIAPNKECSKDPLKEKDLEKQQQQTQQLTETAISSTSTPTTEQVSSTIIKSTYQAHHYCKHHEGQLMEAYCKDVFCIKCAAFKHKLHDYVDVNEIAKEEEENVKKLISELIIKKEIILQRNDQLKLTITKVNEQLELNKNEINLQFDDLQKELNKKKEQLLLEVDKIGNEKLQSLQNENQLLDNYSNVIDNLCQLKNLNNIDILQNKLKLEKEINNLNKLNVLNNLNEMNEFKLNINEDKNNLINLINTKLGNIENKEIKNDQLLFNNTLQKENTLQNNLQLANNVNFNLIRCELIWRNRRKWK
ncbi:hypothetical protein ABK040_015966 [Willaertia magna]